MGTGTHDNSNAGLVRAGYAAVNRGEAAMVLDVLAPDAQLWFRLPGGGYETVRGPGPLARFHAALVTAFDHVRVECRNLVSDGDGVQVDGTLCLRERTTGVTTHTDFSHSFVLRQGRVVAAVFDGAVEPLRVIRGQGRDAEAV